ncbi:MAG TPA: aminomethyltransferase family protein [Minicystis sp.]|nr:aminomethyltransferase family protein [Minicystis sp.]
MLSLKTTPFHPRTSALMQGNQWRRWAGFSVASAYELTPDRELMAIRNACALIDVSPLFKYHVRGRDARRFLDRLVTRDLAKMAVGHVVYTPWCNGRGKVVDDGTISMLGEDLFRLTSAESNLRWLVDNAAGFSVEIEEVSDELGALALQGPASRRLLELLSAKELSGVGYHRFTDVEIAGARVVATRTGYTGDLGYELWIPRAAALAVWDALVEAGRAFALQPAGIWAMDVCRIEAGLIMLDVDYTPAPKAETDAQASSPFELGLGWAVHLKKPAFVGKKALAAEKQRGSPLALVGLEIDHVAFDRAHAELGLTTPLPFVPWRAVTPILHGGEQVGYATCGTWSPTVKKYVALAQVAPSAAAPGTVLSIDLMVDRRRRPFAATVAPLPFFNPERKRG